jgi:hypothetical protein
MAFQEGILLRNAKLNAINNNLGSPATLKVFSGAEPANCAAADPTGLLVTIPLPTTPFGTAASGAINLSAPWSALASASGNAACFRVYDSGGNCAMQGNATTDLVLNPIAVVAGRPVTISVFQLTSGNS